VINICLDISDYEVAQFDALMMIAEQIPLWAIQDMIDYHLDAASAAWESWALYGNQLGISVSALHFHWASVCYDLVELWG
jgi:hypothetical protein